MLEKLTKEWPVGSHIVMKITPRVTGYKPLMAIVYKYRYQKVLVFIATEGTGSTETGVPYLSCFPDNSSNVSILSVLHPHVIVSYFSDYNAIDNHNSTHQSEIAIGKYWLTHSGYFILANTMSSGMGIAYGKLLLCHGIS